MSVRLRWSRSEAAGESSDQVMALGIGFGALTLGMGLEQNIESLDRFKVFILRGEVL